ncbi:hypothetical protein COB11_08655, partial [Candidatus Aerophobetes bacterium]
MSKYLCLIFLFVQSFIHAELVDYLKKADGKGTNHNIRNIDFIYMINLDKRPEKFELSKKQLDKYGITPYRFSAVNGWELPIEAIHAVGLKYQPGMTPL